MKNKTLMERWKENKCSVIREFVKSGEKNNSCRLDRIRYFLGEYGLIYENGKFKLAVLDYTFWRILKIYE